MLQKSHRKKAHTKLAAGEKLWIGTNEMWNEEDCLKKYQVKEIPRNKLKALKRLIFLLLYARCFFLGIDVNVVKFHEYNWNW